ncbi:MAG: hypothetical protein ABC585_03455 [Candidatus Methanosuratincola petrocarbonis]
MGAFSATAAFSFRRYTKSPATQQAPNANAINNAIATMNAAV